MFDTNIFNLKNPMQSKWLLKSITTMHVKIIKNCYISVFWM
jgi:hypothetical protein